MNILLVDDDEIVFKSIGKFLTRLGHTLKTAGDGEQALRLIAEEMPDAIISDIRMPVMDGLTLLNTVRARFPGIPFILITGHGDVDTAISALRKGAYDYIRKPVKLEELIAVLQRIEERRQLETRYARECDRIIQKSL